MPVPAPGAQLRRGGCSDSSYFGHIRHAGGSWSFRHERLLLAVAAVRSRPWIPCFLFDAESMQDGGGTEVFGRLPSGDPTATKQKCQIPFLEARRLMASVSSDEVEVLVVGAGVDGLRCAGAGRA